VLLLEVGNAVRTTPGSRYVDGGELSELVDAGSNRDAIRYLSEHQPSCHSDTGEALIGAAAGKCGDWVVYSPSFQQCRYVALVTNRKVFALGLGQRSVCYRLGQPLYAVALKTGATGAGEIGTDWVRFDLFRADWPAPDLPFWTLKAYAAARADGR
jgi:hypothetical protein